MSFDSDSYLRGVCGRIRKYFEGGARLYLSRHVEKEMETLLGYVDRPYDVSPEFLEIAELFISRYNDMVASMDAAAFRFSDEVRSLLDSYPVQSRRRLPRRIASGSATDDKLVLGNTEAWLNWAVGSDSISVKLDGADSVIRMMRRLDVGDLRPETGRFVEDALAILEGAVGDFHRVVDDAVRDLDDTLGEVSSEAGRVGDDIRSAM